MEKVMDYNSLHPYDKDMAAYLAGFANDADMQQRIAEHRKSVQKRLTVFGFVRKYIHRNPKSKGDK
jgi:adenosyl cobinamide kinase/adenosyl cobinamide phosphate guanylyltransferase